MSERPLTEEGEALLRRHYRTDPGPGLTGGYLDGRAAMAASIRAIEDAARAPLLALLRERPSRGYPCRVCARRDMGHEPGCWYARVAAVLVAGDRP